MLFNKDLTNHKRIIGVVQNKDFSPSTATFGASDATSSSTNSTPNFYPNSYGDENLTGINNNELFTYENASNTLEIIAGRLPTIEELSYSDNDGIYDNQYIWTQTKGPSHLTRWVGLGKQDNLSDLDLKVVSEDELYRVRAYYDVSKANMPVYYDNSSKIRTQTVKSDGSSLVLVAVKI